MFGIGRRSKPGNIDKETVLTVDAEIVQQAVESWKTLYVAATEAEQDRALKEMFASDATFEDPLIKVQWLMTAGSHTSQGSSQGSPTPQPCACIPALSHAAVHIGERCAVQFAPCCALSPRQAVLRDGSSTALHRSPAPCQGHTCSSSLN